MAKLNFQHHTILQKSLLMLAKHDLLLSTLKTIVQRKLHTTPPKTNSSSCHL